MSLLPYDIQKGLEDIHRVENARKQFFSSRKITPIKSSSKGVNKYLLTTKQKRHRKLLKKQKRKHKNRVPVRYKTYIESHWWEERKNVYYRTHRKMCEKCHSVEHVSLHHMLYEDFGHEKDETLMPLCIDCHGEFHKIYGTKHNMIEQTKEFVYGNSKITP